MLKKTIKYKDFNDNERSEVFCFHLSKAETVEWLTTSGDYTLDKLLERIVADRNGKEIMAMFKDFIYRSYGVISVDGRTFDKNDEIKRQFMDSPAYSELFMEIVTSEKNAIEFITGVLPSDLSDEVMKVMKENPDGLPESVRDYIPNFGGPTNFPVR